MIREVWCDRRLDHAEAARTSTPRLPTADHSPPSTVALIGPCELVAASTTEHQQRQVQWTFTASFPNRG